MSVSQLMTEVCRHFCGHGPHSDVCVSLRRLVGEWATSYNPEGQE